MDYHRIRLNGKSMSQFKQNDIDLLISLLLKFEHDWKQAEKIMAGHIVLMILFVFVQLVLVLLSG